MPSLLTGGGMGKGRARSQIIRPQESLALYKLFKTLCLEHKNLELSIILLERILRDVCYIFQILKEWKR